MAGLKFRLSGVLAPRETEFFELLEAAGVNVVRTIELFDELVHYYPHHSELAGEVAEHARRADRLTEQLSERLASTFVTPIEPDDLNALSVALGDVAAGAEQVAELLAVYMVDRVRSPARRVTNVLVACTRELAAALPGLRRGEDSRPQTAEVRRLVREGDELVRTGLAELFAENPEPIELVRWKDLFERLEAGLHACKGAAAVLDAASLKGR